jgi:hypothetical protein
VAVYNYVHYVYQTPEQYYADILADSASSFDTYQDAKEYAKEQNNKSEEGDLPHQVYVQVIVIED